MSSVWLCIPSARPNGGTIPAWKAAGYKVATLRDIATSHGSHPEVDLLIVSSDYRGYSASVNTLVADVLARDPECSFCVIGGDDTLPDPSHPPEEIAAQCSDYFGAFHACNMDRNPAHAKIAECGLDDWKHMSTFGVMQPTGDRFAGGSIDRIAGSPWMGRSFCERMYGGNGPLYHGYEHMHVDEELFCVATMLGVYWPRPDLIHHHQHFMRRDDSINSPAVQKPVPPHLVRWNSPQHWTESQNLFRKRKAQGFPGSAPLPVEACA